MNLIKKSFCYVSTLLLCGCHSDSTGSVIQPSIAVFPIVKRKTEMAYIMKPQTTEMKYSGIA